MRRAGEVNRFERQAAEAIRLARLRRPPMRRFVGELTGLLGWESLSRQTLYDWENGDTLVPAAVLLAAVEVLDTRVDVLLTAMAARTLEGMAPSPRDGLGLTAASGAAAEGAVPPAVDKKRSTSEPAPNHAGSASNP